MSLLCSSPNRVEYPDRVPACIDGSSFLLLLDHTLVVREEAALEVPNAGRE
jgi:hypothetical protein